MDIPTCATATLEEFKSRGTPKRFLRPIAENCIPLENLPPRVRAMVIATGKGKISRNSKCPCGSGKRFKRCCMMTE